MSAGSQLRRLSIAFLSFYATMESKGVYKGGAALGVHCANPQCGAISTSGSWRRGWPLVDGENANLCNRWALGGGSRLEGWHLVRTVGPGTPCPRQSLVTGITGRLTNKGILKGVSQVWAALGKGQAGLPS